VPCTQHWAVFRQHHKLPTLKAVLSASEQQLLADYYAGRLQPAQPAAEVAVSAAVRAQQYSWAKPEWGEYRQRAVVYADTVAVAKASAYGRGTLYQR
jgi:hypothetical protein